MGQPRRMQILRAIGSVALACVLVAGVAGRAAHAAEDDEDDGLTFEQRMLQNFMRGIGLRNGTEDSGINYRERSPLVIPPGRDLPPPQKEDIAKQDPAWPKDADIQRRRAEIKKRKDAVTVDPDEQARRLTPAEMERGRVAAGTRTDGSFDSDSAGRRLTSKELNNKGNIFQTLSIFAGKEKEETGQFTGEPPRASLIEPPVGYQTPSPDQPYGLGKETYKPKATNIKDRGLDQ